MITGFRKPDPATFRCGHAKVPANIVVESPLQNGKRYVKWRCRICKDQSRFKAP